MHLCNNTEWNMLTGWHVDKTLHEQMKSYTSWQINYIIMCSIVKAEFMFSHRLSFEISENQVKFIS